MPATLRKGAGVAPPRPVGYNTDSMTAPAALDLMLVDDEDELFSSGPVQPGSAAVHSADGQLSNLWMGFLRWAVVPPKLAVPLLSAHCRAAGLSVAAASRPFLPRQLEKFRRLLALRPRAAAITTVAMFSPRSVERLTAEIRRISPGTVIILGGHGAENSAEIRALGDLYISGHGEGLLPEVVLALKRGDRLETFPGAEAPPGEVLTLKGTLRYEGLTRRPYPDWSASSTIARRYPVEASRGCRFNCSYCGFPGHSGQEFRPPEEVAGELRADYAARGIRRFDFVDSSLTSDPGFITALCRELKALPFRPDWHCYSRPDAFARDAALAGEMAEAGCTRMFMGVEAIHDHILAGMRRGMDRAAVELGLARVFAAGIKVHGNFIVGFPGETEATVLETAAFIRENKFASAYLCTFGASQEMLDLAAREPERYFHLSGRPTKGWRHDGMDYRGAYELTLRAVKLVNKGRLSVKAISPSTNSPDSPPF